MSATNQRRVLIATSGGIAAYKVPDLVRQLTRAECAVRCALTENASRFVAPLVLQTLTGEAVRTDLFDREQEGQIDHIALADWADLVVVAPATANVMAKLAHGIADDLVSTLLLATRAPVLMAPAMNVNMWEHPATRANVAALRERGVLFVGPEAGDLACGWVGEGRMAEPAAIVGAVELSMGTNRLEGETVVITAGGTREPIDPVRALTNRSSGKMGFALAAEAAQRGADVILVSGPTALDTPAGVERVPVETALEMRTAVARVLDRATVFVGAAAVADFRPAARADRKIKKEDLADGEGLRLDLVRNPDILAEVARASSRGQRFVVGFAAESHDLVDAARRKLERKGCDLIVANDISRSDAGFETDTNAVSLVWPGGDVESLPLATKREIAAQVWDRIEKVRGEKA